MALPVVVEGGLEFRELTRTSELVHAGFGTMAPAPEAAQLNPETLLMPLSAFDDGGNRIGYGQGHYDRAIARLRASGHDPRLVGLAYAMQRVAEVPTEHHDVRLDAVLCEEGLRPTSDRW